LLARTVGDGRDHLAGLLGLARVLALVCGESLGSAHEVKG
jgi:hypothetical protein